MDQEKISKFIKEIRNKDGLSQAKFAQKYGVTFQAVSKWENGKNIPDIAILKQICNDYNVDLNELLDNKVTKKKRILFVGVGFILLLLIILIVLLITHDDHFEFKTLSTTCDNFNLYGSVAYSHNKSSIYISNITYCGGDDVNKYKEIDCTLYENNDKSKVEISTCNYKNNKNITLEEFLQDVNFNVDNYEKTCKEYKDNSLYLEINATDDAGNITTYKIPLELKDNCRN